MREKIKNIEEFLPIVGELKKRGKKIVTTNGSYDILHAGHIGLLEKAKSQGDVLIVLLNSDESIRRNKGDKRPIIPENYRAIMLSALACVDYVIIFPQDKPLEYLEKIKADLHIKGGSWDPERLKEEIEFVKKWGGKYKTFDLEDGLSTTDIINKIIDSYK